MSGFRELLENQQSSEPPARIRMFRDWATVTGFMLLLCFYILVGECPDPPVLNTSNSTNDNPFLASVMLNTLFHLFHPQKLFSMFMKSFVKAFDVDQR